MFYHEVPLNHKSSVLFVKAVDKTTSVSFLGSDLGLQF